MPASSGDWRRKRCTPSWPAGASPLPQDGPSRGRVLTPRRTRPSFWYPVRGFGQICERLAEAAADAGARFVFDAEITAIDLIGDAETSVDRTAAEAGSVAPGDAATMRVAGREGLLASGSTLWSTVPLPVLARLVRTPGAPPEVLDAADRLRSRAMTFVYLVLGGPRFSEFDAHYLPGPETVVSRISEPRNYRVSPADPPDRTVLCAEIPCTVGDETWQASADDLGAQAIDELARTGLGVAARGRGPDLLEVVVRRAPSVYPVYDLGYPEALAIVDDWVGSLPGVVSFGRQGLFAHDNSHHAMATACAAVDALDHTGRVDPTRWSAARRSFADHVVED